MQEILFHNKIDMMKKYGMTDNAPTTITRLGSIFLQKYFWYNQEPTITKKYVNKKNSILSLLDAFSIFSLNKSIMSSLFIFA
ncbi:hypothetical protein MOMA_02205 [Moraxella macacae 0408225]|uniref:Uncharacterized protein n=1 Tax=Moraxella macacae 0408225 TaxID=1230338 RepID=L2F819_9GAMM|nr:hypothetical protein MOMA_02205 [Moraxella macacae 0408225]